MHASATGERESERGTNTAQRARSIAAVRHRHHHHIQAPKPTWLAIGATPPAPSRDAAGRKLAGPASYSPFLLSPSVWRRKDKKRKADDDVGGGVPTSPRIGCMGQVKGGTRGCSSARGPAARALDSEYAAGSLAGLVLGLFGLRRERKPRACSRVRDVPIYSSSSGSAWGRGAQAPALVRLFDPPLPAASPPARDDNALSLWERRRGGGKALEGLRLA